VTGIGPASVVTSFLIRRTLQSVLVLLALSFVVFAGVYVIANPVHVLIDPRASPEQVQAVIRDLGLDLPLWQQYLRFLVNLLHGDLGHSFMMNRPALEVVLERFPATLELAFVGMLMAVLVGFPLGLAAGLRPGSWLDRCVMGGSIVGFSLPSFWVGLLMIMVLSVELRLLPTTGRGATVDVLGVPISILTWDGWRHILMPALNLALFQASLMIRLTRSGVREQLSLDYVRFARAKGLSDRRVVGVHVLKNIMIPIVTVTGIQFGVLIAFTVVTERVFAWPGMGKLMIDSIVSLDRPVIISYVLFTASLFILINLAVDLLYSALDPRVRLASS
jgi:peptide/nickel transport system permease protein